MKRKTILASAIAALVVFAAAAWLLSDSPISEMVGLAAEGGEKILRDPMRPVRDGPRILLIGLDGVGANDFNAAIESGALSSVAALIGAPAQEDGLFANGYAVPNVLSVLPSTTLAAWTSIFTGEPPARTGVPGNEWFAREQLRYYAPAPVSVSGSEQAVEVYSESLMDSVVAVPTLYERLEVRSFVSLSQIQRGADLLTMPDLGGLDEVIAGFARGVVDDEAITQETYENLDRLAVESLLDSLEEFGIPDLQTIYFPGVDLYTHVADDPIRSQLEYLRTVVDPALTAVFAAYRDAGVLERTYLIFVADHGHIPVMHDDRHALDSSGEGEPTSVLEALGFRVRPLEPELDEEDQDFQATVAYQGAFGYIYLADRSTCPNDGDVCDWRSGPRLEDDVLPIVRAFDAANRSGALVPELQGTLDLILARAPRPVGVDALPFQIWDGQRLVDIATYLAANPRPDLLDFERRIGWLAAGPHGHRAGDVLLIARSGIEIPLDQRFYFSHPYRSWHGSATAEDSLVPLWIVGPGRTGEQIRTIVSAALSAQPSQLDVVNVIMGLAAGADEPGAAGR